jgi:hypothetical protein
MAEQFYRQINFSGGLSDSKLFGLDGSFAEAVGVDIHSEPRVLKISQAMAKESGAVVTDLCVFSVNGSDGNAYWFGNTGNIYKRTAVGVWSLVHANANGAVVGAKEFNGYLYYASATQLGRISMTAAGSENPWASQTDSWKTLTSATYHPMVVQGLYLFIGNKATIASVDDAGTFTAGGTASVTFTVLPSQYEITCMIAYGIDFLAGTKVSATFNSAKMYRYDFSKASPIVDYDIPEIGGANCFVRVDDYVFLQAGNEGRIYFYNGQTLDKVKKIRGDYSNKTMKVNPGSSCVFRGLAMFGVSNLSSNPCNQGVYSLGQYDRNYAMALMLEYVISQNKLSNIEIGALLTVGTSLLIAWKDGSTYGVDAIDWSNKYTGAYVTTLVMGGDRQSSKTFNEYVIGYKNKPANTDVALSYYKNYSASDVAITMRDETDYSKITAIQDFEAGVVQFKLAFTVSGNDAPEVDLIFFKWNSQEVL